MDLLRRTRIEQCLLSIRKSPSGSLEIDDLADACWHGIPEDLRSECWPLMLLGKSFLNKANLNRRYQSLSTQYTDHDDAIAKQIDLDLPRTYAFSDTHTRQVLESSSASMRQVLFKWAVRRPASGYVQGMNDILLPFYLVQANSTDKNFVEAVVFWQFDAFLETLQDRYTHGQIALHRQLARLRALLSVLDSSLVIHLEQTLEVSWVSIAFRWFNCLMVREFRDRQVLLRLWDTLLASMAFRKKSTGSTVFLVCFCAAFLLKFAASVKTIKEHGEAMHFLHNELKAFSWTEQDIEVLCSEAFLFEKLYEQMLQAIR